MKQMRTCMTLMLALSLAVSLAVPAAAAPTERGELQYTQVIAPQYEDAKEFNEGYAPVKQNGKWGFIDESGKLVIDFQYDYAWEFMEGYAIVSTIDTTTYPNSPSTYYAMGFVDANNNYTAFKYSDGSPVFYWSEYTPIDEAYLYFHNGVVNIEGFCGDRNGQSYLKEYGCDGPMNEGLIPVFTGSNNERGYVDSNGNLVSLREYDFEEGSCFTALTSLNQGLAAATYYDGNYSIGFVDRDLNWVIQPQYNNYYYQDPFGEQRIFGVTGLAAVQDMNGNWGAIDKTGKTVIPFQYDDLGIVSGGLISFQLNGKYGYLDASTYQVAIPAQYERASMFSEDLGLAAVYDGQKAFLIDKTGTIVPGSDNLKVETYFPSENYTNAPGEYTVIQENGKYGFAKLEYTPNLPAESEMSDWAYEEVTAAIEEDLVPVSLQNLYRNSISREEFCDLVLQAVSEMSGKDVEALVQAQSGKSLSSLRHTYPFSDASSESVIAANALGIINGRGNRVFDPYSKITRQEAAVMLMRAAKVLGMDTDSAPDAGFADSSAIGDVYKDGVNFVNAVNVMSGVGNNNFGPKGNYTREQSFMTIYRLFQALDGQ